MYKILSNILIGLLTITVIVVILVSIYILVYISNIGYYISMGIATLLLAYFLGWAVKGIFDK